MELRDVLRFALRYAVEGIIKELERNKVAPAPPAMRAFLVGAARLLAQLEPEPDQAEGYTGEDGF
jgi:hypothetical protein